MTKTRQFLPLARTDEARQPTQARQRVQVSKVLLTAAVEVDVGVTATRRIDDASNRARWWPRTNDPEGVAAVHRPEPNAPLCSLFAHLQNSCVRAIHGFS